MLKECQICNTSLTGNPDYCPECGWELIVPISEQLSKVIEGKKSIYKQHYDAYKDSLHEKEILDHNYKAAQNEIGKLKKEREEILLEKENLNEEYVRVLSTINNLTEENQKNIDTIANKEKIINDLNKTFSSLKQIIESLNHQNETLQRANQTYRIEIKKLTMENKTLVQEVNTIVRCGRCGISFKYMPIIMFIILVIIGFGVFIFFSKSDGDENLKELSIKTYSGSLENRLPHGNGKAEYFFSNNNPDNGIYEGYFRNGLRHGKGKMVFENGDWYEGNYVDGRAEGFGEFFANGKKEKYIGQWINDVLHGKVSVFNTINGKKLYDAIWDMGIEVSGSRVNSQ